MIKDWSIVNENGTKYIIPNNDTSEHELSTTCVCEPRVEFENGYMIVVHMAFDKRHLTE